MNPLSASDGFFTVAIMSVTFLAEVGLNALKGARDLGSAPPMRGLGLRKLQQRRKCRHHPRSQKGQNAKNSG